MQLTSEQMAVIETDGNLVINAVAGSGKTTTLIEYAKTRPAGSRILYIAFNKTVKMEAVQKFAAAGVNGIKVETAHSLAYQYIIKNNQYQVTQGYKSYEWCDLLGIHTGEHHTDIIIANHVNKFISYFCNSRAAKVQDLDYSMVITDAKAKTFVHNFYSQIEQFTRAALARMDKGDMAVTHDFYLKKFQLSQPVLAYDYILFDEGQDASAAMLEVFLQQRAIRVIVGDTHQQIYGWRYAVNSLQQAPFPVFNLSYSFRFDDEIALIANKILDWKKHLQQAPQVKIKGAGQPGNLVATKATLGRTNTGLLLNAIAQWQHGSIKKIYFEGNINSYTFADEGASLYDVLSLYNGKPEKMWRILNGKDSTEFRLTIDEKGNAADEQQYRRGTGINPVYYYYTDNNQVSDIVRYNSRAKRLLPDFMFEYDENGRMIQKITTLSTIRPDYLIWRYGYNERGLKTKEALFTKDKTLTGRIEYQYTFAQ